MSDDESSSNSRVDVRGTEQRYDAREADQRYDARSTDQRNDSTSSGGGSLLECGICSDVYKEPRKLTCGHTFCLSCLQKQVDASEVSQRSVTCMYCRVVTPLSLQGGVKDLPKNFVVEIFISTLPPPPGVCALQESDRSHSRARYFCLNCWDPLCHDCQSVHTRTTPTKNHIIKLLSLVTEADLQYYKQHRKAQCPVHKENHVTLYCRQCEEFGCSSCTFRTHSGHDCVDLEEADNSFMSQIHGQLDSLRDDDGEHRNRLQTTSGAMKSLAQDKDTQIKDAEKLFTEIENSFKLELDKLLARLATCRSATLQIISEQSDEEHNRLMTNYTNREKVAQSIRERMDELEKHKLPLITVTERYQFLKQLAGLPALQQYVTQENENRYQLLDTTAWKADLNMWAQDTRSVLRNANSSVIPQMDMDAARMDSYAYQSYDNISQPYNRYSNINSLSNTRGGNYGNQRYNNNSSYLNQQQAAAYYNQVMFQQLMSQTGLSQQQLQALSPQQLQQLQALYQQQSGMKSANNEDRPQSTGSGVNNGFANVSAEQEPDDRRRIKSVQHSVDITVRQLKERDCAALIVSAQRGQIIIGTWDDRKLHIYTTDGAHVTSLAVPGADAPVDATWTPRGRILCTTYNSHKVVVMTATGDIIAQTQMSDPAYISISLSGGNAGNVIYVADLKTGVHQSKDDGVTWSHVFKSPDGWKCRQAIKVSRDSNQGGMVDDFLTLEWNGPLTQNDSKWRLRLYSVDKRRSDGGVSWKDVSVPSTVHIDSWTRLGFDGQTSVFLTDYDNSAVHLLSTTGQLKRKLLAGKDFSNNNKPVRVTVDSKAQAGQMMYVGQKDGIVGVFVLAYD